jgi:NAD(P)H dehydrogenase (quinone)
VAAVSLTTAELLQEPWTGKRIVELEGPERVCPNDIATAFANLLGRDVRAEIVPRDTWAAAFTSQGMKNPTPRIRMLDGFNEGWIEFEGGASGSRKGSVPLIDALRDLVGGQAS